MRAWPTVILFVFGFVILYNSFLFLSLIHLSLNLLASSFLLLSMNGYSSSEKMNLEGRFQQSWPPVEQHGLGDYIDSDGWDVNDYTVNIPLMPLRTQCERVGSHFIAEATNQSQSDSSTDNQWPDNGGSWLAPGGNVKHNSLETGVYNARAGSFPLSHASSFCIGNRYEISDSSMAPQIDSSQGSSTQETITSSYQGPGNSAGAFRTLTSADWSGMNTYTTAKNVQSAGSNVLEGSGFPNGFLHALTYDDFGDSDSNITPSIATPNSHNPIDSGHPSPEIVRGWSANTTICSPPDITGHVLEDESFRCAHPNCNSASFGRFTEFKRHRRHRHSDVKPEFYCDFHGCIRSVSGGKPFPRWDKLKDHKQRVHKESM